MKQLILLPLLLLAACAKAPTPPPVIQIGVTQIVITQVNQINITQIAQTAITQIVATSQPTHTPWVVTATPNSPASEILVTSETPAAIAQPPATGTDPLYTIHPPGFYLVGIDIGIGHWRSTGKALERCNWRSTDKNGEFLDGNYGMAGVTITITPDVFQVELSPECGDWIYLPIQ